MALLGSLERETLILGGYPTVTDAITITGPASFKRGDVVSKRNTDGLFFIVDSSKEDGTQNPVGVMCDNVQVGEDETLVTTMYIKGVFNKRALNFGNEDSSEIHKDYMTKIGLIIKETRV